MSFRPPEGFWKNFAQEIWGKQPRVFKKPFGDRLIASPEELFRASVEEADEFAKVAGARVRPACQVFIDNGNIISDTLRYMPRKEDGSFEGWAARMRKLVGPRDFFFHMNTLQGRSPQIFENYRQFTDGMFEQLGLPPWKIDSDMFAGDYRETPFGVHKDVTGNFAFIAVGTKRMLLWPYESLLHYIDGRDVRDLDFVLPLRTFAEIRDQAIVLEGEAGDVFYWPGHFWHSAEGTDSVSVTNNLGIYLTPSPLVDTLPGLVAEKVNPPLDQTQPFTPYEPARRQEMAQAIPEGMRSSTQQVVQGLRQLVEGGLEREMELTWLRFVSGGGFLQGPMPASGVTLDEARSVRLVPHAGLVWRKLASGELAFAVNGQATCLPESRGLPQVLQRLSGGGAHRVRALIDEATEERRGETVVWSRERMREVLTTLLSQHALVYS